MKKPVLSALSLTIALSGLATFSGIAPAGAAPSESDCGGYMDRNRTACFQVFNATEGFYGPGEVDRAHGIKFEKGEWIHESGWVVKGPGGHVKDIRTIPAAAGFDTAHGPVDTVVMSQTKYADTATGAWGTYNFVPTDRNLASLGSLRFLVGIGYSVSDNLNCHGTNPYIDCGLPTSDYGGNAARFDMRLTNRPVIIRIVNHLENHLNVKTHSSSSFLKSTVGSTSSLEVPAAYNREPGEAVLGGFAKIHSELSVNIDYQVGDLAPHSLLTDEYKGTTLQIRIHRMTDGSSKSKCDIGTRTSSTALKCEINGETTSDSGIIHATVNIG
jgi:hypothetical protein